MNRVLLAKWPGQFVRLIETDTKRNGSIAVNEKREMKREEKQNQWKRSKHERKSWEREIEFCDTELAEASSTSDFFFLLIFICRHLCALSRCDARSRSHVHKSQSISKTSQRWKRRNRWEQNAGINDRKWMRQFELVSFIEQKVMTIATAILNLKSDGSDNV